MSTSPLLRQRYPHQRVKEEDARLKQGTTKGEGQKLGKKGVSGKKTPDKAMVKVMYDEERARVARLQQLKKGLPVEDPQNKQVDAILAIAQENVEWAASWLAYWKE